jgi:hypothetical protein
VAVDMAPRSNARSRRYPWSLAAPPACQMPILGFGFRPAYASGTLICTCSDRVCFHTSG